MTALRSEEPPCRTTNLPSGIHGMLITACQHWPCFWVEKTHTSVGNRSLFSEPYRSRVFPSCRQPHSPRFRGQRHSQAPGSEAAEPFSRGSSISSPFAPPRLRFSPDSHTGTAMAARSIPPQRLHGKPRDVPSSSDFPGI